MAPRPGSRLGGSVAILLLLLLAPGAAHAQRSVADLLGLPATPDGEPKAYLSLKKNPSERYRLGYGVVVTAGLDSQKNHSLGIFRDRDDQGPFFRNTEKFDLPEGLRLLPGPGGQRPHPEGGQVGPPSSATRATRARRT